MPIAATANTPTFDDEFVRAEDIAICLQKLAAFADRYKPLLTRSDQERHLDVCLEGLVSGLERKSIEPIANAHDLRRRPLQHFVGAGKWSDLAIRAEMRRHIVEKVGDPDGVLVIDGSGFQKKGVDSVGVARQWCGRLGKIENCQVGIFVAYSTPTAYTLLDCELYLPDDWAADAVRREKTHVPRDIKFRKGWEIADALLRRIGPDVPHAWIVGDDEFGRPTEFRDRLADRGAHYLLEVPSNTRVRRPPSWPGRRSKWCTVSKRRARRSPERWQRITIRDGEKGPVEVFAFSTRVLTERRGAPAREEVLLVMRTIDNKQTWYFLAPKGTKLDTVALVRVAAHRHHVEEVFAMAKGEVGLDHYEVRSWIGWHHHMTLSMLALWFLVLERRRLKKKRPR
jgi:SRSO17 transposase